MSKKLKQKADFECTPYGNALQQLLGSVPSEIEENIEKSKRESEEIKLGIKKTEESIDRGARRTSHRFRL